ncbi:MAG: glycosyltransferase family 1 protein [Thermoflexales bacterium]|nr:glycosyltransferase family 1 protein [Thermoflexales bacterium]
MLNAWYRNSLIPRLVYIPYWITWLALLPLSLIRWAAIKRRPADRVATICMEAGARGWELIEFKELYASACEYLGDERIHKIVINRDEDYLAQVRRAAEQFRPTHYVYDARTGSQQWLQALWQSFRIAMLFYVRGITPICILTDLPMRTWRAQCAMVSARSGMVTSLMSPRRFRPIFPHGRVVAPVLMPFSEATLRTVEDIASHRLEPQPPTAVFVGSLYEPRTTILREIKDGLAVRGFTLEMKGRELGTPKSAEVDYWARLCNAALIVTTADQIAVDGTDWTWFPHLIYRYIEVTACGTLLVAQAVPGIERYFTPGEHFVAYTSPAQAVEVIAHYLAHTEERQRIAQRGQVRAQALIRARIYWTGIDVGLGKDALT